MPSCAHDRHEAHSCAEQDRRRMACSTHPRAVPGPSPEGDGTRLQRRALGRAPSRHLSMRRLRDRAVPFGNQVRVRHRLAELLRPGRPGRRRHRDRSLVLHDPHRSDVRQHAADISATSSTMVRTRPDSATASTRRRWRSTRRTTSRSDRVQADTRGSLDPGQGRTRITTSSVTGSRVAVSLGTAGRTSR